MQLNLWGNKLDLSLSLGKVDANSSKFLFDVSALDNDLLADDSEKVWTAVSDPDSKSAVVGKLHKFDLRKMALFLYLTFVHSLFFLHRRQTEL